MDNASEVNKKQVIEVFQKVAAQATRIDKIIKNIRSFAKRRSTSLEPILLGNVLNDTMELGKLIEKKYNGVRLNYEVPKTLPTVMCDPVQVVQILLNLIRNAADACTEAKSPNLEITVRVTKEEDHVAIAVEDHGPGINDTMKASLFTPFFSTKKNGLGLGLSTCQTIAEAHNTRLEVRDNPGGGTIFSFELKIVANN
ncbi:sensor histidine kinase, partial [Turicimonas muris]